MNNKVLQILIPLVAVVVIIESVVLIQNVQNRKKAGTDNMTADMTALVNSQDETPEATKEEALQESLISLVFGTESKTMKRGESRTVTVNMVPKKDFGLDAVDLFVTYDPEAFDVSGLDYNKILTKPMINKVSTKKPGLIVTQVLDSSPKGMPVAANESLELISFRVTAKREGKFVFDVNKGKSGEESVTMLVDNETNNAVPFSSNKLEINVVN